MLANHCFSVHKFGGSSLANAEKFRNVASLLTGSNEIIVVSAISGTTSTLQSMLDVAKNSLDYQQSLEKLQDNHLTLLEELSLQQHNIGTQIQNDILKIQDILYAIHLTGSYSKELQNLILGYGEIWSAMILQACLNQNNQVAFLDASTVLFIYEKEGLICIDWEKSTTALLDYLKNTIFNQLVITGFIASTSDGKRTTLGRNGSDFSAAIFANLFQAKSLTIWTDVNGIYSADPNIVNSAFVIESLSYKEALELAYFGAKVLHPMTIAPVVEQQIPIYIKNACNPAAKGTLITKHPEKSSRLIKGITCIGKIALITIEGSGLISVSGIASRVFDILHRKAIHVLFISEASSEHSICLAVSSEYADHAIDALSDNLGADIERRHIERIHTDRECAIVSIVGDQMIGATGIASKLFAALAKININIRAISQGSSERNISLIIKNTDANKAIQAIHAGFYLSRKTLSIGLIGPGTVGKSLLAQLQHTIGELNASSQINLCVRGIMNSQKMLLTDAPIDLQHWQDAFNEHAIETNMEQFISHIAASSMPHAAIIDCTANKSIANQYCEFMEKGLHVITPNKHANADDLAYYKKLKKLAKLTNYYFYEATVCAGLPVISTLQDLIRTGDKIHEIEGVVSGTLSFIFNEMGKGALFSSAVIEAKNRGFTEPDPREDLSGMDVARKLVGLAREIGHDVSLDDVAVYNLVPLELRTCSLADFLANLSCYDHTMNHLLAETKSKNQRLHYVGTISHDGKLEVAMKCLPGSHPFSRLESTDNMMIFRTRRYQERPLIIQGPGAGAEVTAAGIFSDLLRLASAL